MHTYSSFAVAEIRKQQEQLSRTLQQAQQNIAEMRTFLAEFMLVRLELWHICYCCQWHLTPSPQKSIEQAQATAQQIANAKIEAARHKNAGNTHFRAGQYQLALESYSLGIQAVCCFAHRAPLGTVGHTVHCILMLLSVCIAGQLRL